MYDTKNFNINNLQNKYDNKLYNDINDYKFWSDIDLNSKNEN